MKNIIYPTKINILTVFIVILISITSCEPKKDEINYEMKFLDISTIPDKRQVNILFQVIDDLNNGVDNLTRDALLILENDDPIDTEAGATIDKGYIPNKIKTILLLDISSSVTDFVKQIKDACVALIENKLLTQEVAIYTFDKDLYLVQDFTSDKTVLKEKINTIPDNNLENSTNLYGAVIEMTNNSKFSWTEELSTKNILVMNMMVFTDGRHNANPSITIEQTLSSIGQKKVYVAALQSPDLKEDPLKKIGNQGYFLAVNIDELKNQFKEIQVKIKKLSESIYFLYYRSPISNPSFRKNNLEISIIGNQNKSSNSKIQTNFNSEGFN